MRRAEAARKVAGQQARRAQCLGTCALRRRAREGCRHGRMCAGARLSRGQARKEHAGDGDGLRRHNELVSGALMTPFRSADRSGAPEWLNTTHLCLNDEAKRRRLRECPPW